jgi:hypothetical protein
MWSIIECQLKSINNTSVYEVYDYWFNLNSVNILQETDEIKYIMFGFTNFVKISLTYKATIKASIDIFKEHMNNIQNMYNLLSKLVGKKTNNIIDDYQDFNDNKSNKSNSKSNYKSKQNKLLDMQVTDDEFLDATEGEKTETEIDDENSEKSDDYNDSYDSDTVFRKATKNTSVRTTKRVNKGSKNNNLTK